MVFGNMSPLIDPGVLVCVYGVITGLVQVSSREAGGKEPLWLLHDGSLQ